MWDIEPVIPNPIFFSKMTFYVEIPTNKGVPLALYLLANKVDSPFFKFIRTPSLLSF